MFRKTAYLATLATLLASTSAFAQGEGFYIGVGGGGNLVHSTDINGNGFNSDLDHDFGFVGTGTVGYKYENGFRNEIELGYRTNDVDEIANVTAEGNTEVYSAMVNLLFDLDITNTNIDTYIGGGAGVAIVRHDKAGLVQGTSLDDSDITPAFQGIAGISYALSDAADIYLNYQYFHASDPNFETENNLKVDSDYDSSSFVLGLKVNLSGGAPTAKPQLMAQKDDFVPVSTFTGDDLVDQAVSSTPKAVPVSRTYIVFFDMDSSHVTPDARAILAQAAEDARKGQAVSVKVIGHTDTVGSDSGNMQLSRQRAKSVESQLVAMGVAPDVIEPVARGESDPLIPTADGVAEPQNRRVEVTYIVNTRPE